MTRIPSLLFLCHQSIILPLNLPRTDMQRLHDHSQEDRRRIKGWWWEVRRCQGLPDTFHLDSKLSDVTLENRGWWEGCRPLDQSHRPPLLPPSLHFSFYSHSDIIKNLRRCPSPWKIHPPFFPLLIKDHRLLNWWAAITERRRALGLPISTSSGIPEKEGRCVL